MSITALEYRDSSKAIKTARQEHKCHKCGATIKPGDKFAMSLDYSTLRNFPICLKCYAEYRPGDYRSTTPG